MSGSIVNTNGSSSITVTNLIEILEGERVGFQAVSLTNMSTTSVSAIAAGSHCEIGGSLYQFSTEEPISTSNITSTSAMTYYVELVPSSSEVTAQFSSVVPTWRDDYQGWYESTSLNYRVVARNYFNGSNYSTGYKYYLNPQYNEYLSTLNAINVRTSSDITVGGSLNNVYLSSNYNNTVARSSFTMSTTSNATNLSYPSGFTSSNTNLISGKVDTGIADYQGYNVVFSYIQYQSTYMQVVTVSTNYYGDLAILYFMKSTD